MKTLIKKIRIYFLNRKISKMMQSFLWEQNSWEIREKIKIRLAKMLNIDCLRDTTTAEFADEGGISFAGYSVNRKKEINISISTRTKI